MNNEDNNKFNFWQNHSVHFLEMAYRPDKRERVQNPDGYGRRTGQCGDTIEMFLTVHGGIITSASFDAEGCLNTIACANTVILMAEGKKIAEAWGITTEDVVDYLETLPSKEAHCAELAVGSLYLALSDYSENEKKQGKIYKKNFQIL